MDTTTIVVLVIAALIILLIGSWLAIVFNRRQRSKNLQEIFGPEYDRVLSKLGDKEETEAVLEDRLDHVKKLDLKPLSEEQKDRFAEDWRQTQAMFVDQPYLAIKAANQLVKEVMAAKGYPEEGSKQRIADLSVDYPELIGNYRQVLAITSKDKQDGLTTEEMRQAMVHCRALFKEVLGSEVLAPTESKEKIG